MIITTPPIFEGHRTCWTPRPELHVHVDPNGHPYATVPCEWMWDLVEYLSFHRLNLSYHFDNLIFRVTFLCQSARAAQQLLDDWAQSAVDEPAHLEHDGVH